MDSCCRKARDDHLLEHGVTVKQPGAVIHLFLGKHKQQGHRTENDIGGIVAQDNLGRLHTELSQAGVKTQPEGGQETRQDHYRISGKTEERDSMRELPAFLGQTKVCATRRKLGPYCLPNINFECPLHAASSSLAS